MHKRISLLCILAAVTAAAAAASSAPTEQDDIPNIIVKLADDAHSEGSFEVQSADAAGDLGKPIGQRTNLRRVPRNPDETLEQQLQRVSAMKGEQKASASCLQCTACPPPSAAALAPAAASSECPQPILQCMRSPGSSLSSPALLHLSPEPSALPWTSLQNQRSPASHAHMAPLPRPTLPLPPSPLPRRRALRRPRQAGHPRCRAPRLWGGRRRGR